MRRSTQDRPTEFRIAFVHKASRAARIHFIRLIDSKHESLPDKRQAQRDCDQQHERPSPIIVYRTTLAFLVYGTSQDNHENPIIRKPTKKIRNKKEARKQPPRNHGTIQQCTSNKSRYRISGPSASNRKSTHLPRPPIASWGETEAESRIYSMPFSSSCWLHVLQR